MNKFLGKLGDVNFTAHKIVNVINNAHFAVL